jgi:hypothetical protein
VVLFANAQNAMSQVAPPSKTDTFATTDSGKKIRLQNREIAGTNFQIAGVDLSAKGEVLEHAAKSLGKIGMVVIDGASAANGQEQVCYQAASSGDTTHLFFARGEVDFSYILASDGRGWSKGSPCLRTEKVNREIATVSGIHLGLTQDQVVAILGLPTRRSANTMYYDLETKKPNDPQYIAEMVKQEHQENPNYNLKMLHDDAAFYDLGVTVKASFTDGALTRFEMAYTATD